MSKESIKQDIVEHIGALPHKEAVKRLALFGSQLHGTATEKSDIDILVEFQPEARIGLFKLAHILQFLEQETGKKVDLVPQEGLSKYFRDEVIAEAETIYEHP